MPGIKWKQPPKSWPPWWSVTAFCWVSTTTHSRLGKDRSRPEMLIVLWKIDFSKRAQHHAGNLQEGSCSPLRSWLQAYTYLPKHANVYTYTERECTHTCMGTNICLCNWEPGENRPFWCQMYQQGAHSGLLLSAKKSAQAYFRKEQGGWLHTLHKTEKHRNLLCSWKSVTYMECLSKDETLGCWCHFCQTGGWCLGKLQLPIPSSVTSGHRPSNAETPLFCTSCDHAEEPKVPHVAGVFFFSVPQELMGIWMLNIVRMDVKVNHTNMS